LNNFAYLNKTVPANYVCGKCGKTHVKLWRIYQSFDLELLCANCAAKNQNKDISTMDKTGRHLGEFGWTDQIGWYIAAVPDEEGFGYWGYTSVPEVGIMWWSNLPNN
jgi:DNA-directed RNA polymerase subunit RPC12/RpoP